MEFQHDWAGAHTELMQVINADANLRGSPGAEPYQAPQYAFRAANETSQSLLGLAGDVSNLGKVQAELKKQKQNQDNHSWMVEEFSNIQKDYQAFAEQNKNNPDFADSFKTFSEDRLNQSYLSAPNSDAISLLKAHALTFTNGAYAQYRHFNEQKDIERSLLSFDTSLENARAAMTADAPTDPTYAAEILSANANALHQSADAQWGKIAPETAAKLHEHIDRQIAQMSMQPNPAFSRKVINDSPYLSEEDRHALNTRLDVLDSENRSVLATQIHESFQSELAVARQNGAKISMPSEESLKAAYAPKELPRVTELYAHQVEVNNSAAGLINRLKDKNASYQNSELARASASREVDPEAVQYAQNHLKQLQDLQEKDPAAWVRTHDDISGLAQVLKSTTANATPDQWTAYNAKILERQGPPPANATAEEAARYLNLPSTQRHLLTIADATQAAELIQGKPSEAMSQLKTFLAQYPDAAQAAIAYNDAVTLPKELGIPQSIQAAALIRNERVQAEFVSAQTAVKQISADIVEKRQEFTKSVLGDHTFQAFATAMNVPFNQWASQLKGFTDGIANYAISIERNEGLKPASAAKEAIKRVISNNGGFAEVNGHKLFIPKERINDPNRIGPPWADRTDDEIADYGRRLTLELSRIDPMLVDVSPKGMNLTNMPKGASRDSVSANQYIRDLITQSGFFYPAPHGQGGYLYVSGDNGPIQVHDIAGNPFYMAWDSAGRFSRPVTTNQSTPWATGTTVPSPLPEAKEQPKSSYPINYKDNPSMFPDWSTDYPETTHWPTNALGWQMQEQAKKLLEQHKMIKTGATQLPKPSSVAPPIKHRFQWFDPNAKDPTSFDLRNF